MLQTPRIFSLLLAAFVTTCSFAQWQNDGFTHMGNARQYRIYKSPNYNPSIPASMVVTLHGLGDNMTNFSGIGMDYVADTANIIVVVPQAMNDALAGTAWNSGAGMMGYFPNSAINDVAFISALIDTVKANYAINPNRIYACGFSMGGFMTNRLAVELNDKITAYASVAGTFGSGLPSYDPDSPVSIAHFHGTADGTVPYAGGDFGISADSLVNFWVDNDQCNAVPQHISVPNTQSDGYTVDHYIYTGGQSGSTVEFYKVTGADHVWLTPSNDIFYTTEIWKFFNKHQTLQTVGINEQEAEAAFSVFPNPATDIISIRYDNAQEGANYTVSLHDLTGKEVFSSPIGITTTTNIHTADLDLRKGMYFVRLTGTDQTGIVRSICIE